MPLLLTFKGHGMKAHDMLMSPILVTHTPKATITKNKETTFTSPSKFAVEKKRKVKNNDHCKAFCITHKRKKINSLITKKQLVFQLILPFGGSCDYAQFFDTFVK